MSMTKREKVLAAATVLVVAFGLAGTQARSRVEAIREKSATAAALADRLETLSAKTGLKTEEIAARCLLTPSCGAGSLSPDLADRILETVGALSRRVRGPGGAEGGA